jgi:hypothetical protein
LFQAILNRKLYQTNVCVPGLSCWFYLDSALLALLILGGCQTRLEQLLFQDDAESQTASEKKEGMKKKKHRVKTVELPIEAHTHGYSQTELNNYMELEVSNQTELR